MIDKDMRSLRMQSFFVLLLLTASSTSGQGIQEPSCTSNGETAFGPRVSKSLECSFVTHFSFITLHLRSFYHPLYTLMIIDSPDLLLQPEHFQHPLLDRLSTVEIRRCNLTTIKPELFTSLRSLNHLILKDNIITELSPNSFEGLKVPEWIFISKNHIATIAKGTFRNMTEARFLYLNDNKLEFVSDYMFEGLRNLNELHLGGNLLTHIRKSSFKGLTSLTQLDIARNEITNISPEAFQDLTKLEYLMLGHNRLAYLDSGLFQMNSNLISLTLDGNDIKDLDNFPLSIPSLESLYLGNNKIEKIPTNYFSNLTYLNVVHLSGNFIGFSVFKLEEFKNARSLRWINLNHNYFVRVDLATFIEAKNLSRELVWRENPWDCSHPNMLAIKSYCTENALDFDTLFRCSDYF